MTTKSTLTDAGIHPGEEAAVSEANPPPEKGKQPSNGSPVQRLIDLIADGAGALVLFIAVAAYLWFAGNTLLKLLYNSWK